MAKSSQNPKVDFYFKKDTKWQKEFEKLRSIALDSGLDEVLKWGHPCYALEGTNVVLMHGFNEYCALLFMKGALMKDPEDILIQQTANVQSARQIRFTSASQITKMKSVLKDYIREAIEVEISGAQVEKKKTSEFAVPEEFQK